MASYELTKLKVMQNPSMKLSKFYKNTNYLFVVQEKKAWVLSQALTLQQWGKDLRKKMKITNSPSKSPHKSPSYALDEKKGKMNLGFALPL